MTRALYLIACLLALAASPLAAQGFGQPAVTDDPALLVADNVFVTPERTLVAEGNVEALQGDTRLRAERIVFDQETGTLTIDGPIRIDQGGTTIVLADFAEMDRDLQNGLLSGARMVLNQQVQMASLQMVRVGGRYTQLYKTAVTSCHVCEDGRPPLWQIRAQRITHDEAEQQLYFENAQVLIGDVPVFYLPALRLPDPTLDRATGFLIPSVRSTTNLKTGVKVPYFFRLGDHADLTLTPYLSPKTRTLEFRYRQAFRRGIYAFFGAYSRDDLLPGETRGYIFGNGSFDIGRGYNLAFAIQAASDNAYLADYGIEDTDRLRSEIVFSRYKPRSAFETRFVFYDSLRDSDTESFLPTVAMNARLERRFFPDRIGGEVRVSLDLFRNDRSSDLDMLGRDVVRGTVDLNWRRSWISNWGLRTDFLTGLAVDQFRVRQDSTYQTNITRHTPYAALGFRYPMTRTDAGGGVQLLEPILQFGWTDVNGPDAPNDESTTVEFDQGNLLALSHFPAPDQREDGVAIAWGLNWSRYGPGGWTISGTAGQVVRRVADPALSKTSGLSGTTSDLLLAGQVRFDTRLSVTARGLIDQNFGFTKAELRGDWSGDRARLTGSYLWLGIDPQENRTDSLSEIWLTGAYDVTPSWTASANLRYDASGDRATRAGLGIAYRNECVTMAFTVKRRYTSSTSIEPLTDFGFTIGLSGFSANTGNKTYRRSCSRT